MATGPISNTGFHRNHVMECETIANEMTNGTAASSAVTINDYSGVITTEDLTTAQNAVATVTMTNSKIAVGDVVLVTLGNGTNTQGTPMLTTVTVTANTAVIKFANKHATSEAFNGTLRIGFVVVKAL
jgi:acyl-CoA synthetase (AMP-forming)/AMP-acid ligase II